MRKKAAALLLALPMLLLAAPVDAVAVPSDGTGWAYKDIDGSWYADAAGKYGYADIFSDGSGKFFPHKKITRMEFVRLLHRALGISIAYFTAPDASDYFDDVKNSNTGAAELIDLVTAGIVEKGGSFRPDGQLDREVMIHWLVRALDYVTGGDYAMIMILPAPFDDDDKISPEYKNDVVKAVVLKLITGRDNNKLHPKDGATRAEAVTAVSRLVRLVESLKPQVSVTASAVEKNGALEMSLTIWNNTDRAVTIHHSSGQKYDFKLFDSGGQTVYTWSADKMFAMATGSTVLNPGESAVFSDTLGGDTWKAVRKSAVLMRAYIVGTSEDFEINAGGYAAEIVK